MMVFKSPIAALIILLSVAVCAAQERDTGWDELVQTGMELLPPDTISNPEVFETNGFLAQSSHNKKLGVDLEPTGNEFQLLSVSADGVFKVYVEKGRPQSAGGGFVVSHRETGTPMLSAGDDDGDGRIDIVGYTVVDENGEAILEVTDYEADGQADLRVNYQDSYYEIWYGDRWYRAEERNGVRGITVDGRFRQIRNMDNRPVVQ